MRLDVALAVGVTSFVVGFSAVGMLRKPALKPAETALKPASAASSALSPPDPRFVYKVLLGAAPPRRKVVSGSCTTRWCHPRGRSMKRA